MSLTFGIDVSKQKLDIFFNGSFDQIDNNKKAIKKFFEKQPKESQMIMEATGKYHRLAHEELEALDFSVMITNPYQTKNFAKALNLLCKTDKVDAKMLATFADKIGFKATPCASKQQQKILDLSRHLDDLKKVKTQLGIRNKESNGFIGKSLDSTISHIKKQIKKTEKELEEAVSQEKELKEKLELLISIPGVGKTTAISLLSYLKELGSVNKRQIAALAGLAPMNNDSGCHQGKRRIKGGRHDVRSHLYMPIVGAATKHNKRLNEFYEKLLRNGKCKKVALTACMRKLVVWANTILASGQPWDANC